MKKTKIVCGIGPASSSVEVLRQMMESGMDVARFDLGRLSYSFCSEAIAKIRKLNDELNRNVTILFDTRGPELRVGTLDNGKVFLKKNSEVKIYESALIGTAEQFSVVYDHLLSDARVGMDFLFHDGKVKVQIVDKGDDFLIGEVVQEGFIFSKEPVHVPKLTYSTDYVSVKDREDIRFAVKEDVDFLALSAVQSHNDVLDVTDELIELGNDHIQLIAKIENMQAVEGLDQIIELSDGIMIARGDLGVEVPLEKLPGIQKRSIAKVHQANKIGLVSTEMLASMEHEVKPTRAEVSDVYNAVMDEVDAVALGNETTIGDYPVETVRMMQKLLIAAENEVDYSLFTVNQQVRPDVTSLIASSIVMTANQLGAKGIVTSTNSGYTAKKISFYRPSCPILAATPSLDTLRSLTLHYGIYPVLMNRFDTSDEIVEYSKQLAIDLLSLKKGDYFVVSGGIPVSLNNTNFMKVEEI